MTDLKAQVFIDPPADFVAKMEVATCYIRSGDKILFVHRNPNKFQGGIWGIPGGKVDKGQEVESEMIREVLEETSIDLTGKQIQSFGYVYIRLPSFDYIYHMYGVLLEDEDPRVVLNPEEHIAFAWLSLKEGLALPLILFEDACTFLVWNDPFFNGCEKPSLNATLKCEDNKSNSVPI